MASAAAASSAQRVAVLLGTMGRVDGAQKIKSILNSPIFKDFLFEFPNAPFSKTNEVVPIEETDLDLLTEYAMIQWARHFLKTNEIGEAVPELLAPPNYSARNYDPVGDIPFRELIPLLISSLFHSCKNVFFNQTLNSHRKTLLVCFEVLTQMQEKIESNNFAHLVKVFKMKFVLLKDKDTSSIREMIFKAAEEIDLDHIEISDLDRLCAPITAQIQEMSVVSEDDDFKTL